MIMLHCCSLKSQSLNQGSCRGSVRKEHQRVARTGVKAREPLQGAAACNISPPSLLPLRISTTVCRTHPLSRQPLSIHEHSRWKTLVTLHTSSSLNSPFLNQNARSKNHTHYQDNCNSIPLTRGTTTLHDSQCTPQPSSHVRASSPWPSHNQHPPLTAPRSAMAPLQYPPTPRTLHPIRPLQSTQPHCRCQSCTQCHLQGTPVPQIIAPQPRTKLPGASRL